MEVETDSVDNRGEKLEKDESGTDNAVERGCSATATGNSLRALLSPSKTGTIMWPSLKTTVNDTTR